VATPPEVNITEKMEELAKLKEKGLISQEEYDSKRSELLARL
jgi:hypothetical protein